MTPIFTLRLRMEFDCLFVQSSLYSIGFRAHLNGFNAYKILGFKFLRETESVCICNWFHLGISLANRKSMCTLHNRIKHSSFCRRLPFSNGGKTLPEYGPTVLTVYVLVYVNQRLLQVQSVKTNSQFFFMQDSIYRPSFVFQLSLKNLLTCISLLPRLISQF